MKTPTLSDARQLNLIAICEAAESLAHKRNELGSLPFTTSIWNLAKKRLATEAQEARVLAILNDLASKPRVTPRHHVNMNEHARRANARLPVLSFLRPTDDAA